MPKRSSLLFVAFFLVCIILVVSLAVSYYNTPKTNGDQPESNPPEIPEGPEFVIPESPIGVLGLVSALAAAFGLFAAMKKRT